MEIDWQLVVIGLRKELGLSQKQMGKLSGINRRNIGRYEHGERTPIQEIQNRLIDIINNEGWGIKSLQSLDKNCISEIENRAKSEILDLEYSEELAELIGIILGDGEVHKCGEIRVSFDPKKDKNFLNRRVIPLIDSIVGKKVYYESNKRIAFGNKSFMKFLKFRCGLEPGSKFEANWKIPDRCLENIDYICAVLRGLFDTDGYIGYLGGSIEIMFGRFSDRCDNLVNDINKCLDRLEIKHYVQHTNDGRYKIRITSQRGVIKFFDLVGSSNIKNIVRFLLWRSLKYEAKIEIEGLPKLRRMINKELSIDLDNLKLPFFWRNNKNFSRFIEEDQTYNEGYNLRDNYNWSLLMKDLMGIINSSELCKIFNIKPRSIRRWRKGTRFPSYKYVPKLLKVANQHKLNIKDYEVRNESIIRSVS